MLQYPDAFGKLLTPANRNSVNWACESPWAVDNGAYSNFDAKRFTWLIDRCVGLPNLLWVACPDVVANAKGTLLRFDEWEPVIRARSLPVAFVVQNRQEFLPVPWDRLDCLFVGGAKECQKCGWILPKGDDAEVCPDCWRVLVEWKESEAATALVREAKQRGKLVHMGRVNSRRRLRHAVRIGCDSVDGTGMSRWGDLHLVKFARWLAQINDSPLLF